MNRGITERARALRRLKTRWYQGKPSARRKLIQALSRDTGFPPSMAGFILDRIFDKLPDLATRPARRTEADPSLRGLIVPGNVPDPLITEVLENFAQGSRTFVKISRRMRRFSTAFLEFVMSVSDLFHDRVEWTVHRDAFIRRTPYFDSVTAYGSDENLEEIRERLPDKSCFRAHGHHFSLGVVFQSALKGGRFEQTVSRCALDAWLYDQRGCLSPQVYFIEEPVGDFASALQRRLLNLERRYGRVRRTYDQRQGRGIFINRLRAEALDDARLELVDEPRRGRAVVYVLKESAFTPGPGGQVIGVKAFRKLEDIRNDLRRFKRTLHGVSVAGSKAEKCRVGELFDRWHLKRLCPAGQMQDPPLDWNLRADA